MEHKKHKTNPNHSEKKSVANTLLSAVANKLKGKELFPEKIEKAKQFFSHLKTA